MAVFSVGCASTEPRRPGAPTVGRVTIPSETYVIPAETLGSALLSQPLISDALGQLHVTTNPHGDVVVTLPEVRDSQSYLKTIETLKAINAGAAQVAPGTPIAGVVAGVATLATGLLGLFYGGERRKRTKQGRALQLVLAEVEKAAEGTESAQRVKELVAARAANLPLIGEEIDKNLSQLGFLYRRARTPPRTQ